MLDHFILIWYNRTSISEKMRVILNMEFYSSAEMKISLAPEQTEYGLENRYVKSSILLALF